jgi:hypothetical protein
MALTLADRVRETTSTTGTGAVTLAGAVAGFRTFSSVLTNSDTTYYAIVTTTGSAWEVGLGTYSANVLTRTTVLDSSNSNTFVNFQAGTKYVFITQPAGKAVYSNGTNIVSADGTSLAPTYGGTGITSYATGDTLYASATNVLSKLGIGTAGQVITSTGTIPTWSSVSGIAVTTISFGTTGLTPASATAGAVTVAGTLATANGGTNLTTFTSGGAVYATSTSALTTGTLPTTGGGTGLASYTAGDITYYASGTTLTALTIGTAGKILSSSGTAPQWVDLSTVGVNTISFGSTGLTPATATGGAVTVAGTLALASGGTGATTVATAQTNLQVDPAGTAVAMAIALG